MLTIGTRVMGTAPQKIELTLKLNSQAFLREAASKFVAAQSEPSQWQFAIIALVQALELALKAKLKAIHPLFVFDNIDAPKHSCNENSAT